MGAEAIDAVLQWAVISKERGGSGEDDVQEMGGRGPWDNQRFFEFYQRWDRVSALGRTGPQVSGPSAVVLSAVEDGLLVLMHRSASGARDSGGRPIHRARILCVSLDHVITQHWSFSACVAAVEH